MSLATFAAVLIAAVLAVGIAVAAMAIGVMFRRPCLRGSCGGPALHAPGGERLSCAGCPRRRDRAPGEDGGHRRG